MIFLISLQCVWATDDEPNGSQLEVRLFSKHGQSKVVSGNRAVEQHYVKLLQTDPGTDQLYPTLGSGLRQLALKQVTPSTLNARTTEIAQALIRAEEQIIASQVGLALPASERLRTMTIQSITYNSGDGWKIHLTLTMEDDNSLRVLLGN